MQYSEAIGYIHSLLKFGIRPGLERIRALLDGLQNPQRSAKVIHVAGTNGKGSTCTFTASVLTAAGYKTGLFTSPYVVDFCERIQIDGVYIEKSTLARLTEQVKAVADRLEAQGNGPTEFEFITALAFLYFQESGCDYVVLETGLGGRLDSTNVVEQPLCTGITNIALDHTGILGSTVEEITREKCGIIKHGCPVVVSPQRYSGVSDIVFRTALARNSDVTVCSMDAVKVLRCDLGGSSFCYDGVQYTLRLIGRHQIANAITAIELLRAARIPLTAAQVCAGLQNAFIPSRLELLSREPIVILDGAHNPDGAAALYDTLSAYGGKFTAIMGMMQDKDYRSAVKCLAPLMASAVTVTVQSNPRSLSAQALADTLHEWVDDVTPVDSYDAALRLAGEKMGDNPLLICGSFYLSGDIRPLALQFFKKSR